MAGGARTPQLFVEPVPHSLRIAWLSLGSPAIQFTTRNQQVPYGKVIRMAAKHLMTSAFAPLLLIASVSLAQEASFPTQPGCMRQNSSRLPGPECGMDANSPIVISNELEFSTRITIPEMEISACDAKISIQYSQRNTIARVNGTVSNESCTASSGSFGISARILDAENEARTLEFPQTWVQENNQTVTIGGDFDIGENVDLVRVLALNLRCKCEEAP